jgi:DNA-binding SARP family transcriptional activator
VLTVAVLGPVDLRRDGVPLAVPAGKTTELLIRLALEAGRPVHAERLIEDLWAGEAVGVARNTLQVKVSKLRRVLGDPALLTGGAAGYDLLSAQLVAAIDDDGPALERILEQARAAGDYAIELLTLDARSRRSLAAYRAVTMSQRSALRRR